MGQGRLHQSFTCWQLTPVPTLAANNWPEPGPSWPAVYVPQPPTRTYSIGSLLIFHQNGSYILLTISLPPQPVHDILQVSQSVSVSSNEIIAFILHTPHLSYSKKYFIFSFNLTFKPIHFSFSVVVQLCETAQDSLPGDRGVGVASNIECLSVLLSAACTWASAIWAWACAVSAENKRRGFIYMHACMYVYILIHNTIVERNVAKVVKCWKILV